MCDFFCEKFRSKLEINELKSMLSFALLLRFDADTKYKTRGEESCSSHGKLMREIGAAKKNKRLMDSLGPRLLPFHGEFPRSSHNALPQDQLASLHPDFPTRLYLHQFLSTQLHSRFYSILR